MCSTEEKRRNYLFNINSIIDMLAVMFSSFCCTLSHVGVKFSLQPCYYAHPSPPPKKEPKHLCLRFFHELKYLITFIGFFFLCCVDPNWLKNSLMGAVLLCFSCITNDFNTDLLEWVEPVSQYLTELY